MALPDSLTTRPLTMADSAAVTAAMAADELAAVGRILIEEADIVSDWQRPGVDLAANSIGVFEDGELRGYAELSDMPGRGDAVVHPEHTGRGIGTWLAMWMQEHARARGDETIGMPVPEGSPGEALLRSLGYELRWTSWSLVFPPGKDLAAPTLPAGYSLREAVSDDDRIAMWHVVEDAFLEWSVREKDTFEQWSAGTTGRPGFEPWNLRVAVAPDAAVVGGVQIVRSEEGAGYVPRLAVRKDQRGRGLARALLADAFAAARAHGATSSELSTDSRTGALDLYLGLGMEIADTWVNLAADL